MSAAQMKRIAALEQTLSKRYASEWEAFIEIQDIWLEATFKGVEDHKLETDLYTANPAVDAWIASFNLLTFQTEELSDLERWAERVYELLEKNDSPPYPVPKLPPFDPAPDTEAADLLEREACHSPDPALVRFTVQGMRAHTRFLESVAQRWSVSRDSILSDRHSRLA